MTIQEIANITGLSTATVHRAMNQPDAVSEKVRQKIQQVINEISEHPNYIRQVYVVLPHMNTFYSTFLVELINLLIKFDIQTIPYISNGDPQKEEEFFNSINFSSRVGLVWSPVSETADYSFLRRRKNKPVIILLNHTLSNYKSEISILRANDDACKIAIESLIKENAKSILFLTGESRTAKERTKSFYKYMKRFPNIKQEVIIADFDNWQGSYNIISEHKDKFREFDAVISANEMLTYACLKLFRDMDIQIGKDIQFIGFDYAPALDATSISMVHFSPANMAQKTCDFLIEKTVQDDYAVQHHFMPQLFLLGSEKKSR